MMDVAKKKLLKRYQVKIAQMEDRLVSYPDMVNYTVAFATKYNLTSADMKSVIPKDILECSMPSVLDMIDAPEGMELE